MLIRPFVETDTAVVTALNNANVPELSELDEDGTRHLVALKRNGEIALYDAKDRELEKYKVPYGARIRVQDGETVKKGQTLVEWDPHVTPILAEKGGTVRWKDLEEDITFRVEIGRAHV